MQIPVLKDNDNTPFLDASTYFLKHDDDDDDDDVDDDDDDDSVDWELLLTGIGASLFRLIHDVQLVMQPT